jgi:hypothetical protein
VFIVFCCFTNILVTAMLLTGGAGVIEFLTGAPTAATVFLFPIGVVIYTLHGGIKATFITDYINTLVFLIIIFAFAFTTYASNSILGSPGQLWDIITNLATERPLEGNAGGSYLTMRSQGGGEFFVINLIGNFGTVFLDNGYYNKAIATSPVHALPGYVMGGLSWFAVPWVTATCMGLAGLALEGYDVWPTYPERMADADVTAGLVLPNVAVAMMGKGGAVATIMLAVSHGATLVKEHPRTDVIAVHGHHEHVLFRAHLRVIHLVLRYLQDLHQPASNREATYARQLHFHDRVCALHGRVLYHAVLYRHWYGLSLPSNGRHYLLCCGSSGHDLDLEGPGKSSDLNSVSFRCDANDAQSWAAATFSPILGFCCSMAFWLGTTYATAGEISIESTGANTPMLVGNVVALCSPLIFVPLLTYVPPFKPQKYDWVSMASISKGDDSDTVASSAILDPEQMSTDGAALQPTVSHAEERSQLDRAAKTARILCVTLVLCFIILWPMPLFGTGYIFGKRFFTGWIVVGIIWLFFSTAVVVFLPLWQSRKTISHTIKSVFADMTGKGGRRGKPEVMQGETADGEVTPPQMLEKLDVKE